jgi:Spy/CpxP family protein refolding chaperone
MLGLDGNQKGLVTALALLVSVFMAGVLTAVAVVTVLDRDEPEWAERRGEWDGRRGGRDGRGGKGGRPGPDGPWGFGGRGEAVVEVLAEELDLSEEQQDQMAEILARREGIAVEVMEATRGRLTAIMDSIDAEIREQVLTPEQAERFEELKSEGRDRLENRFPRPPGMRPPPDRRPPRRGN